VEAVEELVGLEAMQVEPPVGMEAVAIYMYPRIMVQAEEDMAVTMEVEAEPEAVGMEVLSAPPRRSPPTDMAVAVAVEFNFPEKVAPY
jgi:hypothetical protein